MTIQAIYENGVFRPTEPVDIAEHTKVEVIVPAPEAKHCGNQEELFALLRQNYPSGHSDTAARHNEHQP